MKRFKVFLFAGALLSPASWTTTELGGSETFHYVGAAKCKSCHLKQYTSWTTTRMAKSFDVLKPGARPEAKKKMGQDPSKDYTRDSRCLPCHTTGYGKPGGFRSVEETPELAGVQCEACHGPHSKVLEVMTIKNKNYKRSDVLKAGLEIPTDKTCKDQCHNPKSPMVPSGYTFDFETNKKKGTHQHLPLQYQHD